MTLILSLPESLSQQQSPKEGKLIQYEMSLNDPTGQSRGYQQSIDLRPGFDLLIDDHNLHDDLLVEKVSRASWTGLEFSFNIAGNVECEGMLPGKTFIYSGLLSDSGGFRRWRAGQQITKFDIHIGWQVFKALITDQLEQFPLVLRQALDNPDALCLKSIGTITPAMQTVLHQLLNCPYNGAIRHLYLEGKAMELMALRVDQFIESYGKSVSQSILQGDDIDRIYYAKEILLQHLVNPPSLIDLAHQVGLNDCTLKRGFRQMFGTTAFGFLRQLRMERAKQLLETGQLGVEEAAKAVGYASPTSFSNAFRKTFGVNPRTYRVATSKRML